MSYFGNLNCHRGIKQILDYNLDKKRKWNKESIFSQKDKTL